MLIRLSLLSGLHIANLDLTQLGLRITITLFHTKICQSYKAAYICPTLRSITITGRAAYLLSLLYWDDANVAFADGGCQLEMKTSGATGNDKVDTMITLGFQWNIIDSRHIAVEYNTILSTIRKGEIYNQLCSNYKRHHIPRNYERSVGRLFYSFFSLYCWGGGGGG